MILGNVIFHGHYQIYILLFNKLHMRDHEVLTL